MKKVTYITKSDNEVVERTQASEFDIKLRASALGWRLQSIEELDLERDLSALELMQAYRIYKTKDTLHEVAEAMGISVNNLFRQMQEIQPI